MDEKGNIPHYHWFSDTLENIDRDLLQYGRLPHGVLQALPEAVSAQRLRNCARRRIDVALGMSACCRLLCALLCQLLYLHLCVEPCASV